MKTDRNFTDSWVKIVVDKCWLNSAFKVQPHATCEFSDTACRSKAHFTVKLVNRLNSTMPSVFQTLISNDRFSFMTSKL